MAKLWWEQARGWINTSRHLVDLEIWCGTILRSRMRKGAPQLIQVLLEKEADLQENHKRIFNQTIKKLKAIK